MPRSTDPLLRELLAALEPQLASARQLRRRLHAEPELAHAERHTAALVAQALPVAGETVAGTGLIARIGPPAGAAVAVRAELDGLPLSERTGAAFSARGSTMHACGHDVHMAALIALARAAHGLGERLPVALLAVFQPSEERYPSGAELLARGELAQLAPVAVLGAHIQPELPWGTLALDAGAVNASSDTIEITIEGEPSHGAYPHRGRDPIVALAQVVVTLYEQAARRLDPMHPALVNIGVIAGGASENMIPARATARASLRAFSAADRATLRELASEVVSGTAAAHGCRGTIELTVGEPPLENDVRIVAAAGELMSAAAFAPAAPWRSCGSDDFAFFGELAPLAMAFVGLDGAAEFRSRPLHHPELLPPEASVAAVARAQAVLYVATVRALELRQSA